MTEPDSAPLRNPFTYAGEHTRHISFPLGGIGTGCIGLSGSGHLVDWEIFNRPGKGTRNGYTHFAVKAETTRGKLIDARVLHGDMRFDHCGDGSSHGFGMPTESLDGLPHFRHTDFRAAFPFAEIHFHNRRFPGRISLQAFNPFIPLNDRDSGMPAAFFTVSIRNTAGRALDYTVAFTTANPSHYGQHRVTINQARQRKGVHLLHLTNTADPADVTYGDFTAATDADQVVVQPCWFRGSAADGLGVYWRDFTAPAPMPRRTYREAKSTPWWQPEHGCLTAKVRVPARSTRRVRFVFAWNVPNCENYWSSKTPETEHAPPRAWKNHYATRFKDSLTCATYCLKHWDRLEGDSRRFQIALFESSLPAPVLDAVSANISILKTPTCLRLEDGEFYGWEGCRSTSGCCEGSCTHVWNYAYALPFLFPALERSMRELDYRYNLRADGGMPFRLQLPLGSQRSAFRPCADGQLGGVLKVYREWKVCGDTAWLQRLWPDIKKSIEFAWSPDNEDRWDPDKTGVLHGRQHHTLDRELFGPTSWLTGFYLGALKAGAAMADACGEPDVAREYRAIFARGRAWVEQHLFNGEYFVQDIRLDDRTVLRPFRHDPGVASYWSREHRQLTKQIGEGCGIDQVVAQWHADLIGLGDLFSPRLVRRALRAIYRHNFHTSMRDVANPYRLFAVDDEAGTTMFEWPDGREKPAVPIPYANETMHGFEYQAACHMIMRGMVGQGVRMVKAVRDRYDGSRRNPWNEMECGSHYARSMASYALLHAFSGFHYDMVRQEIGFSPVRQPTQQVRYFWSLNDAWGTVALSDDRVVLTVLYGQLHLRRFRLTLPPHPRVAARLNRKLQACTVTRDGLTFERVLKAVPGEALSIKIQAEA